MRRLAPLLCLLALAAGCGGGQGGGTTTSAARGATSPRRVFQAQVNVTCKATLTTLGTLRGKNVDRTALAAAADAALKKLTSVKAPAGLAGEYRAFLSDLRGERRAFGAGNAKRGIAFQQKANAAAGKLRLNRCVQPKPAA